MKNVIYYHNDLDGKCAAAILHNSDNIIHTQEDKYVQYCYHDMDTSIVDNDDDVYIVDCSFTEETVHYLFDIHKKVGKNLIWIDHHYSSMKLINSGKYEEFDNIRYIVSDKRCGAWLTWKFNNYIHESLPSLRHIIDVDMYDELPNYIHIIDDYDRWIGKYGDITTKFKYAMDAKNHDYHSAVWSNLISDQDDKYLNKLVSRGSYIMDYANNDNKLYFNSFSYESIISGYRAIVVNKKCNSYIFGEHYGEYDIHCVFAFDGEKYSYSIYSNRDDINCAEIAESYGGGGHRGAAGFSSTELLFKKV